MDLPAYETLIVDLNDSIVEVTMNRPRVKNAADQTMWNELLDVGRRIEASAQVRAVVLTGAGGDFCSGADVSGMGGGGPSGERLHSLASMRHIAQICLTWFHLPQPTIAKVRGVAAGAGMNLALACDLLVAADGARFSEIFARRGLTIDFGGSFTLPRRVGMHRAKELVLLADIIDAQTAAEFGLVNRVVADAELDGFVANWATRLAAGPPIALAMSKRLLNNSLNATLEGALDEEGLSQTVNFSTADTREAVSAFIEKRSPLFRGS
jgi:2-(1,2-epoxy-1,2-dihydrophenyl)acetyl-CoA isomerase